MNNGKLHHVGIICSDQSMGDLCDLLAHIGNDNAFHHKRIKEFHCDCYLVDGIEFVVPYGGPLLQWLEDQGTSIHHFAVEVEDIHQVCESLRKLGIILVTEEPVQGVGNILVNFIHPEEYGIMIELVQVLDD